MLVLQEALAARAAARRAADAARRAAMQPAPSPTNSELNAEFDAAEALLRNSGILIEWDLMTKHEQTLELQVAMTDPVVKRALAQAGVLSILPSEVASKKVCANLFLSCSGCALTCIMCAACCEEAGRRGRGVVQEKSWCASGLPVSRSGRCCWW